MSPLQLAFGLAQFAPAVIKWITGSDKAEEVATKVVEVAEVVTGTKGEQALEKLRADPQAVLDFQRAIGDRELEWDRIYLADRQDARKRDVALAQSGHRNKRADFMVAMAALGTAGGFIGMLALGYLKAKYPDAISEGVFGALLAQLSMITSFFGLCLRDAFQFEFGSSRGSAEKTDLLMRQQNNPK